jgi:hypothetical protein
VSTIARPRSPLPSRPSIVLLAALAGAVLTAALVLASEAADARFDGSASSPPRDGSARTDPAPPASPGSDTDAPPSTAPRSEPPEAEEAPGAAPGPEAGDEADDPGTGREPLRIQHVGDVLLDRDAHPTLDALGSTVWDGARETFARGHVVVANLECAATTRDEPQPKSFVFRCDPDELPAMRDAGVTAATVANNHSGDHGILGIVDSLRQVEAAGMVALGAGEDEDEAYAPRLVDVEGWKVALLGFGGVVPDPDWTARGDRPGQASGYDAAAMARAVEAANAEADLVVVSIHWGEEGAFVPRDEDRERAEAIVAAGADVVFGHHAHRLQPLERIDGVPVFWNLGNFVWPRISDESAITAVAEVTVSTDGEVEACLVPFEIEADGRPFPTGAPTRCH